MKIERDIYDFETFLKTEGWNITFSDDFLYGDNGTFLLRASIEQDFVELAEKASFDRWANSGCWEAKYPHSKESFQVILEKIAHRELDQ